MNITLEKTDSLTAAIQVHLEPADYKDGVNEELKKQARKVSLPGFRVGKVPPGIVRKMIGKGVVAEVLSKQVNELLNGYIQEQNLNLLGEPLPLVQLGEEDFDIYCEKDMNFSFEIGMAPEFVLNLDAVEKIPTYEIVIDDAFLQKELATYQDRFGDVTAPEAAGMGDFMYGELVETGADGLPVEGGFSKLISLAPVRLSDPSFQASFVGQKVDEYRPIDIFALDADPEAAAKQLFMSVEEFEALRGKTLSFKLSRLSRIEKAAIGPDLFEKIAGDLDWEDPEQYHDEAVFMERFRQHLSNDVQEDANRYARLKMQEGLLAAHPMQLPDAFLKRWIVATRENYDEQRVEKEYDDFTKSVFWNMITTRLQEEAPDLKVTREDIEAKMKDSLRSSFLRRGEEATDENMQMYLAHFMQNEEMVTMQYRRVEEEKIFGYLKDRLKPAVEPMTATDYIAKTRG
ncbi:MAG: trigger factor [Bacteroidia bacterium]|nr:trigger factor [Bacteroidia bacterium]